MTVIMIIDVLGHETYSVTAAMLALLAVLQCAKWSYTQKKKTFIFVPRQFLMLTSNMLCVVDLHILATSLDTVCM